MDRPVAGSRRPGEEDAAPRPGLHRSNTLRWLDDLGGQLAHVPMGLRGVFDQQLEGEVPAHVLRDHEQIDGLANDLSRAKQFDDVFAIGWHENPGSTVRLLRCRGPGPDPQSATGSLFLLRGNPGLSCAVSARIAT